MAAIVQPALKPASGFRRGGSGEMAGVEPEFERALFNELFHRPSGASAPSGIDATPAGRLPWQNAPRNSPARRPGDRTACALPANCEFFPANRDLARAVDGLDRGRAPRFLRAMPTDKRR